jgi:hypothetical protein
VVVDLENKIDIEPAAQKRQGTAALQSTKFGAITS